MLVLGPVDGGLLHEDGLMEKYYEEISVWKRLSSEVAVRYSCFRNLGTCKYGVQSADYFRLPVDEKQVSQFARQFLELLIEVDPDERCTWFDSLDEAIRSHEEDFS